MDHQEWLDKFRTRLRFEEDRFIFNPLILLEEWKVVENALIRMAIEFLPPHEKRIIKHLFYNHLTIREVAEKIGISKSAVHRVKKRALNRLARSIFVRLALPAGRLKPKLAT